MGEGFEGVEGLSKKEKGLMDNSVMTAEAWDIWGYMVMEKI